MRRVGALLACLAVSGTGCGGEGGASTADAPTAPVDGGTCIIGFFSEIDNLNEFVSTDANATEIMEHMLYVPLLRWDENFEIAPRLAESWEHSNEGKTVTFQLRDDITWHDGVPTTAEDVKFTFERFRDPALAYSDVGALRYLETVEVLEPYVIRFTFSVAYADQLAHLRKIILPRHLLEHVPSAEMESAEFNRNPVGNGPFRFVRWKQQQEVVLEANPDFPDGRPHLDRVVFRFIPDQTAIETAFRSGQIDVVERLRYETVQPFREDPDFQVLTWEQRGYSYVGWNVLNPLFQDARVRRALTLAIDRQRIIDALVFGEGKVTAHPLMSLSSAYASDIEPHPYDPEEARRLLAEVGWADTDGDGVLDRDGEKFEFVLTTNLGNQLREDTLVMIQDDLAKVGVSMTPRVREWSVFLDQLKGKDFDAGHLAWQTDFLYDPYDLFHSDAIDGKYNFTSFSHPRVDVLIETGLLAPTREEANEIWHEYQEILHREQPYTVLFELFYSHGASRRIRDFRGDVRSFLVYVTDWWIAPADRKYAS